MGTIEYSPPSSPDNSSKQSEDNGTSLSPKRLEELLDNALIEATGADPARLGKLRQEMNRRVEKLTKKLPDTGV